MNRVIKFRAWDAIHKCFDEVVAANLLYQMHDTQNEDVDPEYGTRFFLQQFTSLLDKNGKEIYEGDIVKCGYGTGRVEYNEHIGAFLVVWIDDTKAEMELLGLDKRFRRLRDGIELFEIIGNVYQNPELLTP